MNQPYPLSRLAKGSSAIVAHISTVGTMRRRLLDLGLVPGTKICCLYCNPAGSPIAFLIRGAVIALRKEDAAQIFVLPLPKQKIYTVALAGNPNVGKSSIFNQLTGLHQHTGNWPGKTVIQMTGQYTYQAKQYHLIDLPGTYSLLTHSVEEEIARDFICFSKPDVIIVVCDSTCLERNFNLVLQTLEISSRVIVCLNLIDEAKKHHIQIDFSRLSKILSVPIVATNARNRDGFIQLQEQVAAVAMQTDDHNGIPLISYPAYLKEAIRKITGILSEQADRSLPAHWIALQLLGGDPCICHKLTYLVPQLSSQHKKLEDILATVQQQHPLLQDQIAESITRTAEKIYTDTVCLDIPAEQSRSLERKLDLIFTNRVTGIPLMLFLLCFIFWITLFGANIPSDILSFIFAKGEHFFLQIAAFLHVPHWLSGIMIFGIYRVVTFVISVMLPPMAIFFPLFTLLEDLGYLPRIAFNLDHHFKCACACGKQALTMCMGFGCNAAGVIGCRIIDSPRERLIAILTNNFVPCNGRFPTLIVLLSMFFLPQNGKLYPVLLCGICLTGLICIGIFLTFLTSRLLSHTILKGMPSSFTLELPPYRKPQIIKIFIHSIFDRTLFVLWRAIRVAAPAGLLIWLLANCQIGSHSILIHCANILDPFAKQFGLDGVILLAFILGFPANEIVIPIIIMTYLSTGTITEFQHLSDLKALLLSHGWTTVTACSTLLFCLVHWPCSTTCLTIQKETGQFKWTLLSILIPTISGLFICFLFTKCYPIIQMLFS